MYDLEQTFEQVAREDLIVEVLDDRLGLDELLTTHYVRDLHRRLYSDVWTWAGSFRWLEVSIGVPPEQIATELHGGLEGIRYRWEHTQDWTAHEVGIAAHAEVVRIHPFIDGNGRSTRLLGDLVYLAAQSADDPPAVYD
ncbi:Fic family protein [Cellulomonas soli]